MIHPLVIAALTPSIGGTLTLTATDIHHDVITTGPGGVAWAGIQVNTDGTVDQWGPNFQTSQINDATDWIIPNSAAVSSYEVRITNEVWTDGPETYDVEAAEPDVWVPLTENRVWRFSDNTDAAGGKAVSFDLEIRAGSSGAADVSASISLRATNFDEEA